eukprot:s505_g20.t1
MPDQQSSAKPFGMCLRRVHKCLILWLTLLLAWHDCRAFGPKLCPWQLSMSREAALAGGIAGGVESVVVQPLEMIKTRFQLSKAANPTMGICILWRRSERKDVAQHGFFGEGLAEVDALREDSVLIPDRLIVAENGERGCMKAEHRERCYCASS